MDIIEKIKKIMDDKQVEDIVTIDFRENSPFLDYFLIGNVRNNRMASAVLDAIDDFCALNGIKVNSIEKGKESKWYLMDIGSIVIHVFFDGEREKYDIEGLWKDLILK